MSKGEGISYGILIPIFVLFIVMVSIGEKWLLLPIGVLVIIFIADTLENSKIKKKREEIDHWKAPRTGTYSSEPVPDTRRTVQKPIYDQKKQKEQGVSCGTLIPIIFIGWLFIVSQSWVFLIPLLCLVASLIDNLTKNERGSTKIRDEMRGGNVKTVSDISDRTGLPEEKVRERIVTEKRSGSSDVWFDPASGEITRTPIRVVEPTATKSVGCVYCGFALKPEDRFCPFCGAPIKASG